MNHLVLIGAGATHLHFLSTLAAHPLAGVRVTWIATPEPRFLGRMLARFVAGNVALGECTQEMAGLLKGTGVTWLQSGVLGLDVDAHGLTLDNGSTQPFEHLSIDVEPVPDRISLDQQMPGVREHALFVRPLAIFATLWPQVVELAQQRPLSVAVVADDDTGFELACAVAHRLPRSRITWVTAASEMARQPPPRVRRLMQGALQRLGITVLDARAVAFTADAVQLSNGAQLLSDVPIVMVGNQAPNWLTRSALARNASGSLKVDACQRSVSHGHVWLAWELGDCGEGQLPSRGADALRVAVQMAANLRAAMTGTKPRPIAPASRSLQFLDSGGHRAIGYWGPWAFEGAWVGWLKRRTERGDVRQFCG